MCVYLYIELEESYQTHVLCFITRFNLTCELNIIFLILTEEMRSGLSRVSAAWSALLYSQTPENHVRTKITSLGLKQIISGVIGGSEVNGGDSTVSSCIRRVKC